MQEQHPDRALLFHQWQQMDFPLFVDSMNQLGVKVVPIHVLVDPRGVVAAVNPRPEDLGALIDGMTVSYTKDEDSSVVAEPRKASLLAQGTQAFVQLRDTAQAIRLLRQAVKEDPQADRAWFRLGVALRHRFEEAGDPADFAAAIAAWQTALHLDPNQYIWRRRIQQFGPRLDKPYPFYDWVAQARAEVEARMEEPIALRVEPKGAELTAPLRRGAGEEQRPPDFPVFPDPESRITEDDGLLEAAAVVVRDTQGRNAARVHLTIQPNRLRQAHWNNEVEAAKVWLILPERWSSPQPFAELPMRVSAVSDEKRTAEFELRWPELDGPLPELQAVLLAHVCEGADGTCVYRRLPIKIRL